MPQARLPQFKKYPMIIMFVDLEDSTRICEKLKNDWVSFLQALFGGIELKVQNYAKDGAHRHKLIGDGALIKFSSHLASPTRKKKPGMKALAQKAVELVEDLNQYIQLMIARAKKKPGTFRWVGPLCEYMEKEKKDHLTVYAGITVGLITPFNEPSLASRRHRPRREITGITINLAQRLAKVHDSLLTNNVFVCKTVFKLLLPRQQQWLDNIADLQLKGFEKIERIHSGRLIGESHKPRSQTH